MTKFWSVLFATLMEFFTANMPSWMADFIKGLLVKQAESMPDPELLVVGVAPEDLKSKLQLLIESLVKQTLASRPTILKLALRFVAMIPDSVYDGMWDRMLILLTPANTTSSLPPRMVHAQSAEPTVGSFQIDEIDLSMAKLEAGVA